jgi:hypothetical protein
MSLHQFNDQWEEILASVDKTKIPLDCIKKMTIKLDGRKQKTINISTLIKQGMDLGEIESFLNRTLDSYGDEVLNIDFIVDLDKVQEKVQPQTNDFLKEL